MVRDRSVRPFTWRCKTFLIDPPFLFTIGSLFALAGRRRLVSRKPNPFVLSSWAAVGFAFIFWISVSPFVWKAPDWMLSYFVPAETLPMVALHLVFGLGLVIAALSGHTMTAVLLQRGQTIAAGSTLASGLVVLGSLWGMTIERYVTFGTYSEFVNGQSIAITESSIAGMMNIVGIIQGLTAGALLLWIHVDGKRLRAR